MEEEYETGICGRNWWSSSPKSGSSQCSMALSDIGGFGWPDHEMVERKKRSCEESCSISNSSIVNCGDIQRPQGSDSIGSGGDVLIDSTLQMMDFGLSSPTTDWNKALIGSRGSTENNFQSMVQEDLHSRSNFQQENQIESVQILQQNWGTKDYSSGGSKDSCINFWIGSTPTSTLLRGLFESDDPQYQQSPYNNRMMNYSVNSNELSFLETSPPKQQHSNHLLFSNDTPFWNASATSMNDVQSSFCPSQQTQLLTPNFKEKTNVKLNKEEALDSSSVVKKSTSESTFKRPRIETPSPLPTFKVRKEKLGDRVTALQQLVSPFGKTDTASVLFEAIEYIKFLHKQVSVLSTPYMKNGIPPQYKQNCDISKDTEGGKQDLRSRGLCLAPISITFPASNVTCTEIWTPKF